MTAVLLVAACGTGSGAALDGGSCPNDVPQQCPATVPSYERDVEPLVKSVCQNCHVPGGRSSNFPLTTYDELSGLATDALSQVASCQMPQLPTPALTEAQRQLLMAWLVCGAPNN